LTAVNETTINAPRSTEAGRRGGLCDNSATRRARVADCLTTTIARASRRGSFLEREW